MVSVMGNSTPGWGGGSCHFKWIRRIDLIKKGDVEPSFEGSDRVGLVDNWRRKAMLPEDYT